MSYSLKVDERYDYEKDTPVIRLGVTVNQERFYVIFQKDSNDIETLVSGLLSLADKIKQAVDSKD